MSQQISPADRIRELSRISEQTAAIVEAAGRAINVLTNRSPITKGDDTHMISEEDSLDARKQAFEGHVNDYYNNLQAVIAKLRRQTYALEEAGIIAAEAPVLSSARDPRQSAASTGANGRPAAHQPPNEGDKITNGGLGSLDIGYLNSRGNKVGAEKEAELIQEAKALLEELTADPDRSDAMG